MYLTKGQFDKDSPSFTTVCCPFRDSIRDITSRSERFCCVIASALSPWPVPTFCSSPSCCVSASFAFPCNTDRRFPSFFRFLTVLPPSPLFFPSHRRHPTLPPSFPLQKSRTRTIPTPHYSSRQVQIRVIPLFATFPLGTSHFGGEAG